MRKLSMWYAVVLVALLGVAPATFAQSRELPDVITRVDLSDAELTRIETIVAETMGGAETARAELNVLRAQVTRELVREEPNRAEVERLLRASLEWELTLRLAEIDRQLAIREVVGNLRWSRLARTARELRESGRLPEFRRRLLDDAAGDPRARRLLDLLEHF